MGAEENKKFRQDLLDFRDNPLSFDCDEEPEKRNRRENCL